MREVTEKFKVYTWETAPENVRENIREFFASNSHGDWIIDERLDTLKGLADLLYCHLDYSISLVPSRGEFIEMTPHDSDYSRLAEDIKAFIQDNKDCSLTGVCYDEDLKDFLRKHIDNEECLSYALQDYLDDIHKEYRYTLSDEYLAEHCEANEYEFTENGKIY